ncbi:MAG: mechanosensitive ion channel [Myxococcales bacterium]|nr:mechanosensitive ion channel family protein [Myxococcota bacterium]MDW8281002.1 mechanosensitive ion channel [Myxococcales bacterium]
MRSPRCLFWCSFLLTVAAAALAGPALAQLPEEGPEPDSPRRTVERFLMAARVGRYAEAAQELDLSGVGKERGPTLARQLREVLDQRMQLDLDKISDNPAGNRQDGLPADTEEIGRLAGPTGHEPVRLQRLGEGEAASWKFSRQTVRRIPAWYDRLPDRWLREHLPEPLWRSGPLNILFWQWLALPPLLMICYLLGRLLAWLLRVVVNSLVRRTPWQWDDALAAGLERPGRLIFTALLGHLALHMLHLPSGGQRLLSSVLGVLVLVGVFWAMWRFVSAMIGVAQHSEWVRMHPAALGMLPLGERLAKMALLAFGLVVMLRELGFEVTSLLAGIGIGGLGIALAAQKTVEHLFGGITLTADQPMRVGDMVKIDAIQGVVEHIGLRSTRIRTADRTVVTIPNGRLADMSIETMAARDRIRLHMMLGLVYHTTSAQLRAILSEIESLLRGHKRVWPELVVVRLAGLGQSALDVEIMCWFETTDFNEFRALREEVLIAMLEIVEKHGSAIAFPTRTVHLMEQRSGRA